MSKKDDTWMRIEADLDAEFPGLPSDLRRNIVARVVARVKSPAFKEELRRRVKEELIKSGAFDRNSELARLLDSPCLQSPQAPRLAGVVLTVLAKSPAVAEAAIGCLHERFVRDCDRYGVRHATFYCWAETMRSLWPLLCRAIGRAVKWAVIVSAVKRYFVG